MVEFPFLQITTCRFQAARYLNCSGAYFAFASRLFTDHARQRFHPLTDNGCCLVCLLRGSRAELSGLDRHTTNGVAYLVTILLETPLNFLLVLLARVPVSLLEQADQLVLMTADPFEIVIREFTPPRFKLAAHLLPLSCQDIPVHGIGLDIVFHLQLPPYID